MNTQALRSTKMKARCNRAAVIRKTNKDLMAPGATMLPG